MSDERNTGGTSRRIEADIIDTISNNKILVAVLAFLYILPLATGTTLTPLRALLFLLAQIMVFGLLAMSFDLQLGRGGLLNFGQVALFGVGAYFMAFTLDSSILPYPLNIVAYIPYPLTLVLAVLVGAGLGFIMGLTTSRMRGTAFAFIALAIAMFLYNFFAETPDISGGETGLRVAVPDLIRTAPFYLLFVALAFIFFSSFFVMIIHYLRGRRELFGLVLFIPIIASFVGFLLLFGTNIIGPMIVLVAFFASIVLYWLERSKSVGDPLAFSEPPLYAKNVQTPNRFLSLVLPLIILIVAVVGLSLTFGSNIMQMVVAWVLQTDTFAYPIPVQYYLILSCVVMVYFFTRRLVASPFGRMVAAVAQNEERAEALGYNVYFCKIVVLVIAGAIAGLAGGLFAPLARTIGPESALGVEGTINAMLYTIIGGIGTLLGPLVGAALVVYSQLRLVDFIQSGLHLPGDLWLVALGVLYVVIVLFMPRGIVGTIQNKTRSVKEKLSQLKIGGFEVGIRESDYWVFALLGIMSLFLLVYFASL
jgi:ABC-type branched-subunit amino acid transport system permease subunit